MKALAARLEAPIQPVVGRDETAKRAAFGEVPPRGMEEQALRLADRIAAAGSRTQGLARGEAAGGVGAGHSSSKESGGASRSIMFLACNVPFASLLIEKENGVPAGYRL